MTVQFYFDPSCPFSWIASRWLLMVQGRRDITIMWRPFSLALKNGELNPSSSTATSHAAVHRASHRVLRVMLAAEKEGVSLIDLYTSAGIQFHIAGNDFDDELIRVMLAERKLPAKLLAAAGDERYDDELQASITAATDVAGSDIGTPTILFQTSDGSYNGFFGPVLQTLPDQDEALKLWDGLSALATNKSFYELKRSRPGGDPDVASTARY